MIKEISLDLQIRSADITQQSDNLIEVIFSTGAIVRRYSQDFVYDEELEITKEAIRTVRLNGGAPVLDTHESSSVANVIGIVVPDSVVIEAGVARAKIKLDSGNRSLARKIKDGIIRNVSVGYVVHKFIIAQDLDVPLYRAVDWEPYEVSLVPIGADSGARIRGSPSTFPCKIINNNKNVIMKKEEIEPNLNRSIMLPENVPPDIEEIVSLEEKEETQVMQIPIKQEDLLKNERARASEIEQIVKTAKLPESLALELIVKGESIENTRQIVLDNLVTKSNGIRARILKDEVEGLTPLVENALLHRYNPGSFSLNPDARNFRGMSLMEIGKDLLMRRGIKAQGMSRTETAGMVLGLETRGGYMATSDFPHILANIANKALRASYEAAPQTFKIFTRQTIAPDFKMMARVQLGDAPSLDKVNESGEFKRGSISDSKEQYALATYGKVVAINRQVIINDDLDAFTRLPALFGRAAADLESDTVWGIINANAQMGDGVALFHASHSNLSSTGGAISTATLGFAREQMRKQKGLNGRFINVSAKYLLVPASLETTAQQMMATTNVIYNKSIDVNPFAGTLQIIAEPRLDANSLTAWYLSADPTQIDTIEYAYLEGQEGVYLESRIGFDVDGLELKARLDFAAKAIDFRGLYKNPGSATN